MVVNKLFSRRAERCLADVLLLFGKILQKMEFDHVYVQRFELDDVDIVSS